jgi:tetratricopeptide (TPR) repeat protein
MAPLKSYNGYNFNKVAVFRCNNNSSNNLTFRKMGWPTGLEPATTRTTIWGSTIELRPPSLRCRIRILRFESCFAKKRTRFLNSLQAFWQSPERWIVIDTSIIIAPHLRMNRIGSILFIGFFFLALNQFAGQRDDPSETFLKAYMTAQQGEKFEHDNQFKTALAKYRFAGSLIEELRKSHADWQPAIVEYRGRKISEAILRIQGKVSTQNDLTAGGNRLPEAVPALPQGGGPSGAGVEVMTSRATEATPRSPSDATIKETTRKLRDNLDQLQAALEKSQSDLETARKEKELVSARLQQSNSKLEKAQSEIEKSKKAEEQVRDQLAQARESLRTLQSSRESDTKEQQQLRAEVARLKDAVAAADEARAKAEKQKDETNTKFAEANKQIASLVQERDGAIAQLKGMKETEQRVQALLAENSDLKQKFASAEKSVRALGEDIPKNTEEFANANRQVAQLNEQLADTQKQNQYFEARVAELSVQLDDASAQLQSAKLTGANPEETTHLTKENELLRNIIVRERQEEARRYEAKKVMLAELDKLKIQSDALNKQIEFLAQPITKLSDEELALFREPVVSISDQNSGALKASFIFAKKSSIGSVTIAEPDEREKPSREVGGATTNNSSDSNAPGDFKPAVPDDLQNVARGAKESFEQGKYRTAESKYQEILAESPNNLYALSNLGAVYIRRGKFKAAELTLKKALAVSPKDEFAHTTLGIVYYRQAKFDDAVAELTKSLEINPKSPVAHNYLGITASQKGRLGEAEKEILQAIANNPDYADAHFNLAVILATTQPSSKELAKRHYTRATALGTQPDPSLEKLLQ